MCPESCPYVSHALEDAIGRGWLLEHLEEKRRQEERKAVFAALRASGFDLCEAVGPRAETNMRLWDEVIREAEIGR